MNYKIKITEQNREVVKRIANENGMNPESFFFDYINTFYIIKDNRLVAGNVGENDSMFSDHEELTTEQFIELFDKSVEPKKVEINYDGFPSRPTENSNLSNDKIDSFIALKPKTELETWLEETKAKGLSLEELDFFIGEGKYSIYEKLKGEFSKNKAQILYDQWNKEPKVEEWKPKRGERVLVWDDENDKENPQERIFVAEIKGANEPIITVHVSFEKAFHDSSIFYTQCFKFAKPIPQEEPKPIEKSYKQKVVEVIEKESENYKQQFEKAIKLTDFAGSSCNFIATMALDNLLTKIKELS